VLIMCWPVLVVSGAMRLEEILFFETAAHIPKTSITNDVA
jgi:hypothetical protein